MEDESDTDYDPTTPSDSESDNVNIDFRAIEALTCVIDADKDSRKAVARTLCKEYGIDGSSITGRNAKKTLNKRLSTLQKVAVESGQVPLRVAKARLLNPRPVGGNAGITTLPNKTFAAGKVLPGLKVDPCSLEWMKNGVKYVLRTDHACRHGCVGAGTCANGEPCGLGLDGGVLEKCAELRRVSDVASFLRVILEREELAFLEGCRNADAVLRDLGPDGIIFDRKNQLVLPVFTVGGGKTVIQGFLYVTNFVHVHWLATNLRGGLGTLQARMLDNENPAARALKAERKAATAAQRIKMDKQYPAALCGVFVEANRDDNPCLMVEKSVGISIWKRTALDGFGCLMPTTEIDVSEVCLPSLAWPFRFVDQTVWQRSIGRIDSREEQGSGGGSEKRSSLGRQGSGRDC